MLIYDGTRLMMVMIFDTIDDNIDDSIDDNINDIT
jgi:hypothetical protein